MSSKLNIAFYTDTYEPAVDGVVVHLNTITKELERRGHNVYIFASKRMDQKVPKKKNVFYYAGMGFKPYPQYSFALFPYLSGYDISKLDIDMIHAHTPFSMGLSGLINARAANLPIVGSFHTMVNDKSIISDYYPKNPQLKEFSVKYLWKYVKFFYRSCNVTTAPSDVIVEMLKHNDIPNTYKLPLAVDTSLFQSKIKGDKFRANHNIKLDEKVVLFVGRLSKEKKLEVLLKAAASLNKKHDDLRFVIAGGGPAEHHYKALAKKLHLNNLSFVGPVARNDLAEVYAASDLFCLPSTFETQSIVSIEAMAMGKPVICANSLALKELVTDGKNGEKFKPGDYVDCGRKIEKALKEPNAYTKHSIETSKRFSPERVTDTLLEVYEPLLKE